MRRIDGRPVPGARRFRARTARHSGTGRAVRVSRGACSCGAALVLAGALAACSEAPSGEAAGGWQRTPDGVIVELGDGDFRRVRLQVIDDAIVRVTATPRTDFANLPEPLMVVAEPAAVPFEAEAAGGVLRLTTPAIDAEVALDTGAVTFRDAAGNVLLAEAERSLAPVTQDPGPVAGDSYAVRQQFHRAEDEALYGLGQHQSGDVNHAGENVTLTTHNVFISIPFLVSTRGWGLLWNNASITRVGSPEPPRPLGDGFELYDAAGEPGALTVRYYAGEDLVLEARAADLDYQYLDHGNVREHPLPEAVADLDDLKITWEGTIIPKRSGTYDLEMYSSGYARLVLDGEALLDRWRVNWNPWYHETKAALEKGQRYRLRVEWDTQGGYFRLLHYPPPAAETLSIASETAKAIDYYFVAGASADEAIAGYRKLTGKAVMLPRWAYGYWQSRERYKTQEDLIGVLEEYRERGIPIDNIVLDWFYWPEDAWGSHAFDAERFPDPRAMVERVHELDAHIMVSVWPKFYPGTDHYRALDEAGCLFNKNIEHGNVDWVGPGYPNAFYDAFDASCAALYWQQVRDRLGVLGFDAWWLDAVEPDMHSNLSKRHRKDLMTPNARGTGAEYFNAYALPHAEAVYRGEREAGDGVRSFILTRSGFGGIQRAGAAIWSGDVGSRWLNLKEQIAAGIGIGLSGVPYWTFDIGGFTPENRFRWGPSGDIETAFQLPEALRSEWQELYLRWFQFGTFAPLFRSHGQSPFREIFNVAEAGSEVYDSLVYYTKLRYRLLPYIYTLAGDAYHADGTIMRGLVMDFPDDPRVRDIATEYLFGPAFLVAPVYEQGARRRDVYLPAGADWYDFYTGEKYRGGSAVAADAPLSRMPLFVRAGSIVPTGPALRHTGESLNAPLTLLVYTGADGAFDLYEDDGTTYDYEQGEWSRIPFRYDEASGVLTIGQRIGGFDEMARERRIAVRWIDGADPEAADFDAEPDATVTYRGEPLAVQRR
ncbi:MAG TPA: TIM-barrel domain-containing protein [Woeseiaceae bacterium]|nr:TIM-barrel domain-containing protein [Woeseiaceae bacterium]